MVNEYPLVDLINHEYVKWLTVCKLNVIFTSDSFPIIAIFLLIMSEACIISWKRHRVDRIYSPDNVPQAQESRNGSGSVSSECLFWDRMRKIKFN